MNGKRENYQSLCRGDENRPPTPDFSEHPVEWYAPSRLPQRGSREDGPYHSTNRPETATLRAIFIAPTEL